MAKVKNSAAEREAVALYKAVARYVKFHGGIVVLSSGIQVQQWPGERAGNFVVGVKCTGRKPSYGDEESK